MFSTRGRLPSGNVRSTIGNVIVLGEVEWFGSGLWINLIIHRDDRGQLTRFWSAGKSRDSIDTYGSATAMVFSEP